MFSLGQHLSLLQSNSSGEETLDTQKYVPIVNGERMVPKEDKSAAKLGCN